MLKKGLKGLFGGGGGGVGEEMHHVYKDNAFIAKSNVKFLQCSAHF